MGTVTHHSTEVPIIPISIHPSIHPPRTNSEMKIEHRGQGQSGAPSLAVCNHASLHPVHPSKPGGELNWVLAEVSWDLAVPPRMGMSLAMGHEFVRRAGGMLGCHG